MRNKLFLVCPFSTMENYLRNIFGDSVLFITTPGAVINFNDTEFMQQLKHLTESENISEIYCVSDISCRFIDNAIKNVASYTSYPQNVISRLLENNFELVMTKQDIESQKKALAQLVVYYVANGLNTIFHRLGMLQTQVKINELVTSKKSNQIIQHITKH